MRNKKLIPFEVIEKAVAGEPEAIDIVLKHYIPRIKYLSKYRGHINDDIQEPVSYTHLTLPTTSRV